MLIVDTKSGLLSLEIEPFKDQPEVPHWRLSTEAFLDF